MDATSRSPSRSVYEGYSCLWYCQGAYNGVFSLEDPLEVHSRADYDSVIFDGH